MEFESAKEELDSEKPDAVKYAREQVLDGYLFLDWFGIPQITARVEGVNEDTTRSEAALAVQSIPFYVEVSNIFLALVPEMKHKDTGNFCNYSSWFCRGWCRQPHRVPKRPSEETWQSHCSSWSSGPFSALVLLNSYLHSVIAPKALHLPPEPTPAFPPMRC